MKVITLNRETAQKLSKELLSKAVDSGFVPDLVLAVRSGGAQAGALMAPFLPPGCEILECSTVRKSGRLKKHFLKNILKRLPQRMLDILRVLEAKTFKNKSRGKILKVDLPASIERFHKILVVDDAVDSGATLLAVVSAVRDINPATEIRTAAITVTSAEASGLCDFYIYNNETLIRFPWSMDAKKRDA